MVQVTKHYVVFWWSCIKPYNKRKSYKKEGVSHQSHLKEEPMILIDFYVSFLVQEYFYNMHWKAQLMNH